MKDVMLDLETLGKEPGCVIMSIGAVAFNPHEIDSSGPKLYFNIELTSSIMAGLMFDRDTLEWWQKQNAQALQKMGENASKLEDVCFDFTDWFNNNKFEKIWSQGATFDIPIFEFVLKKIGIRIPWKYYNVRDTRTVYDLYGLDTRTVKREGTHHNALDDCLHQIKCVQTAVALHG